MRQFIFVSSVLLSCVLATATNAREPDRQAECSTDREFRTALDSELTGLAAHDRFSGAVLVTRNDRTVFQSAYGYADREHKVRATPNTRFRFGSIAKMFTGAAIMQLVQAGRVRLEDPVNVYLTNYPNAQVGNVTIHQLLTHTGGTGDIFGPEFAAHRLELKTLADYVDLYGKRGTLFQPGTRHEYSNYGYILLGRIIEVVSGLDYDEYVSRHIFRPAGMFSTGNRPEADHVPRLAVPYTVPPPSPASPTQSGALIPATDLLPYRGNSAGGGYSTIHDLQRFVAALTSHKLLNAYYTNLYLTGKVSTPKPGTQYAYGIEDGFTMNGTEFHGHSGGAPGMNASVYFYPDTGETIIVLANLDPPAADDVHRLIEATLAE